MHSLTYVMKQSRPNKKRQTNSISQRQKQPQYSSIVNSARRRIHTQPIQQNGQSNNNSNIHAQKSKKKFIEQSVFLPYINPRKQERQRERQRQAEKQKQRFYYHHRLHSYGDQLRNVMDSDDEQTMQYLNECDLIISNLKKLNYISSNKVRRKVPYSTNDHYGNGREANLGKSRRRLQDYSNQFQQNMHEQLKNKLKQNANSKRQANSKPRTKQEQDQLDKKTQLQQRLAKRKQKFMVKFLNVAKDRGFQLKNKINQYMSKKSLSNKKKEQNPQTGNDHRSSNLSKEKQKDKKLST